MMIMKKTILFISTALLTMLTACSSGVTINETNFPDENFRNYLLTQDYGEDGVLTDDEIAGVTELILNEKSIQSLKGIECFTALTGLNCAGNQLTSLDLSKNTELTLMMCANNQLTSLDLSKNTALTDVNCSFNQLTLLDVSGCTALTLLMCYDNCLTSLDVSGCTALTSLMCTDNQLTSLDMSKCTALTLLYGHTNELTSLDVSKCTALTSLGCSGNQLTSLDVSKCTKLETLSCCGNQIKGAEMDAFVNSLPTVTEGELKVIDSQGDEQNVMTSSQVAAAKAKGWIPKN